MEVSTLKDEANYIIKVVAAKQVSRGKISLRHMKIFPMHREQKSGRFLTYFLEMVLLCARLV